MNAGSMESGTASVASLWVNERSGPGGSECCECWQRAMQFAVAALIVPAWLSDLQREENSPICRGPVAVGPDVFREAHHPRQDRRSTERAGDRRPAPMFDP